MCKKLFLILIGVLFISVSYADGYDTTFLEKLCDITPKEILITKQDQCFFIIKQYNDYKKLSDIAKKEIEFVQQDRRWFLIKRYYSN